jgi:hypothetical protein
VLERLRFNLRMRLFHHMSADADIPPLPAIFLGGILHAIVRSFP